MHVPSKKIPRVSVHKIIAFIRKVLEMFVTLNNISDTKSFIDKLLAYQNNWNSSKFISNIK